MTHLHQPLSLLSALIPRPGLHLSALFELTSAWLPASIHRREGDVLEHVSLRCPSGSAATARPIVADLFANTPFPFPRGTSAAGVSLSNDDLINGDTPLAVEWDGHWQGASMGFQRPMVKIEADMRHPAYEDAELRGQTSGRSGCVSSVNVLLLIWRRVFILCAVNVVCLRLRKWLA